MASAASGCDYGLNSVDLFEYQPKFPICIAFGNEVEGLRPELLDITDTHVRIPMLGKKTSLSVATAAGVVLYEQLRKYRMLKQGPVQSPPPLAKFLIQRES